MKNNDDRLETDDILDETKKLENNSNGDENCKSTTLTKKQEFWNFVKFVLFSISAGVIQIVSYELLSKLVFMDSSAMQYDWSYYGWSYFISLALSVIWNFTFNKKFTFKSAKNVPVAMLLVLAFYLAFTPLSILWGIALVKAGWNDTLVLLLTMVINFVLEFLWTRFVVYRNSINTAKKKETKND